MSTYSVEDLTAIAGKVMLMRRGKAMLQTTMQSVRTEDLVEDRRQQAPPQVGRRMPTANVHHQADRVPRELPLRKAMPVEVFLAL